MRRAAFFLSILTMPSLVTAQLSHTPLPPVPAIQPLYPAVHRTRPAPVWAEAPRPLTLASAPIAPVQFVPPVGPAPVAVAYVAKPVVAAPAATIAPAPVLVPAGAEVLLPPNTDVLVRLEENVSSKVKRVGDSFRLKVVQDVMHQGVVVIPRGTPAVGSVVWRTGKGMFGKSAKMEITVDRLTLQGKAVPLFGRFREEGQGNTGATIGTALAAGVIAAAFVTGHSAVFPAGREFRVSTREAVALGPPLLATPTLVATATAASGAPE